MRLASGSVAGLQDQAEFRRIRPEHVFNLHRLLVDLSPEGCHAGRS